MSSLSLAKKPKLEITTTNPNWLELPRDITSNILQRLGTVEILKNACNVCPYWWNICKDPSMWREIHMGTFHLYFEYSVRGTPDLDCLVKMCQYAVDLSSAHLEKIDIYRFGTDALLQYIADRACNLRSIQLDSCIRISDEGFCEVAKKCPLLEEISISYGFQSLKSLEVIGLSCPLLKSLKFNASRGYFGCDDEALIIAKTMPGLRHLDIHESPLSDVGLIAILDGCPLLESLDIRGCHNLEFSGNLWKRLHNQIKDLEVKDYFNNFELEFAFSDSNGNSYWEIVERFSDEDEAEDDNDESLKQ